MESFTLQLRRYVEQSGKKLNAIANTAHITYNYLYYVLNGSRHPSEQVVLALTNALQLSPEQAGELLASAGYFPSMSLLRPGDQITAPITSAEQADNHVK